MKPAGHNNHNPRVGGSSPSPATNNFNDLDKILDFDECLNSASGDKWGTFVPLVAINGTVLFAAII